MAERSPVIWSIGWTATGSAVAQALNAFLIPVLTRLYSPASFGIFTIVQSLAGLGSALGGFRYEYALVLARSDRMVAALVAVQLVSVVIITLSAGTVLFTCFPSLSPLEAAQGWLWAVPTLIALSGISQVVTYYLIRQGAFKHLSVMRVLQAGLSAGLPLLGVFRRTGAGGLVLGAVIGSALSIVLPTRSLMRGIRSAIRRVRFRVMRRAARAHFRFPLYSMPYGFVGALRERGLLLLVATFASVDAAGVLGVAMRLSFLPAAFMSGALGPVIYREAAGAGRDSDELRRLLRRLITILGMSFAPVAAVLISQGENLLEILLGHSWRGAGTFVSILAIPSVTLLMSGVSDRLFDVRKRQGLALTIESVYSTTSLIAVVALFSGGASATASIAVFAALTSVYHVLWMVLAYREWRLPVKDLCVAFAWTATTGLLAWLLVESWPLLEL